MFIIAAFHSTFYRKITQLRRKDKILFTHTYSLGDFYFFLFHFFFKKRSRGSSVSAVTDYGLDDRGSIPDRDRGFFF
jgi:hypothetical protein